MLPISLGGGTDEIVGAFPDAETWKVQKKERTCNTHTDNSNIRIGCS